MKTIQLTEELAHQLLCILDYAKEMNEEHIEDMKRLKLEHYDALEYQDTLVELIKAIK